MGWFFGKERVDIRTFERSDGCKIRKNRKLGMLLCFDLHGWLRWAIIITVCVKVQSPCKKAENRRNSSLVRCIFHSGKRVFHKFVQVKEFEL
jgi:hypothetical protein